MTRQKTAPRPSQSGNAPLRSRQGGFLIAKVHRTAGRIFARMLRERHIDTNPAHGSVLFVLWEDGPLTIHELAKRVSLGKSTLTATLDRMEARGQVRRVRSADDRRKILVELTPQDPAMQALYAEVSREMTTLFYANFTGPEIDAFEASLARILDNLERR